jgi:hypothetical protein
MLVLLALLFAPRYRSASLWIRCIYTLASLGALAWSGLGFFLLAHHGRGQSLTDLPWDTFWMLDHIKAVVAGITVGLFLALLLHPDFRNLSFGSRERI